MEQDQRTRKGIAVTKPIELRVKKASTPGQAKVERRQASHCQQDTAPVTVSMIAAGHARTGGQKPEIIDQIGQRLRAVYNNVLQQPIPDRFHDLLRELETRTPVEVNRRSPGPARKSKDSK